MNITIKVPKDAETKNKVLIKDLKKRVQEYTDNVLVSDRDWDFAFLLELICYKLNRMQYCLKDGISEDSNKICKQMQIVEQALIRINEDAYYEQEVDKVYKKYGIKTAIVNCKLEIVDKNGNVVKDKKFDKVFKLAQQTADKQMRHDVDLAFDTMKMYFNHWWE